MGARYGRFTGMLALFILVGCRASPGKAKPPATEEEYLVAEVAKTVGRWTARPARPAVKLLQSSVGSATWEVALGRTQTRVSLQDAVWDPKSYVLLVTGSAATAVACSDDRWAVSLLTPTAASLLAADRDLSGALRDTPTNPCLHEAAALLATVFAAREYPGMYYDLRPYLSRATGHLALARAYGSSLTSLTGRVAEMMLLALSWRQSDLPRRIADLAREFPSEPGPHWVHAISLLSLQDFREIEQVEAPSRLELLAAGLAVSMKAQPKRLVSFISEHGDEASDWPRIAISRAMSVETCNAIDEAEVQAVLDEAELVLNVPRGGGQLAARLNFEGEEGEPSVLGTEMWALFEQKALLPVLRARFECYDYWYGARDEAARVSRQIEKTYSGLRLFPFLLNQIAKDKATADRAATAIVALTTERPELVTWSNWSYIPWDSRIGPRPAGMPDEAKWFVPLLPRGTAFEYNQRYYSRRLHRPNQAFLDQAHAQVQHALATKLWLEGRHGNTSTAAFRRAAYGPVVAFDRDALLDIAAAAEGKDKAEEIKAYQELCTLLPEDCDLLALSLRGAGREQEAADAYEAWARVGEAVTVANRIDWAVEYLASRGATQRAERLARQAANTGSGPGLATYGKFLEQVGRIDDAFEQFRWIEDSYGNPAELAAFLSRHRQVPPLRRALDALVKGAFPDGLVNVTRPDLDREGSGAAGARVRFAPKDEKLSGLQADDLIVAVDGLRVTSLRQQRVARALKPDEKAVALIWRRGSLIEVVLARAAFSETTFESR